MRAALQRGRMPRKNFEKNIAAVATNFFLEGGVHLKSPQNNRQFGEKAVNPNSKHQNQVFCSEKQARDV